MANTSSIINYRPHKQQLQLCGNWIRIALLIPAAFVTLRLFVAMNVITFEALKT